MKARPFQLLGFDVLIDKVRKGRRRVNLVVSCCFLRPNTSITLRSPLLI
jgi:hypothetical protein